MRTRIVFGVVLVLVVAGSAAADLIASRVTCANTATLAYTAPPRGGQVTLKNAGANSIFLGGSNVTTATGFELGVGTAVSLPMMPNEKAWCIVAAATERLDKIESQRLP